jgi:hypothetical protein
MKITNIKAIAIILEAIFSTLLIVLKKLSSLQAIAK